ncbi:AI-2E family transporter [Clostridium sp. J1101437_171009_A5]|uniref:AI-2E family transporter n=1 Tax=Clostridium sp. J1101437_171009_A5 TaxID=2787098 RepID=UPI00189B7E9E|nr:AI-2E family transporter [Clostridium sp. J1101437_171009_A5]
MYIDWKSCARIGIAAFLLYLCITYWSVFADLFQNLLQAAIPLLLGCVLAYAINILMSFYEAHYFPRSPNSALIKSRRPVCMLAAFLTLAILLIFIVKLVIPELVSCIKLLAGQVPTAINNLLAWLETKNIVPENILASLQTVDWRAKAQQIITFLTSGISSVMGAAVSAAVSVFSGAVTLLLALIFSIYLLLGKEKLGSQFHRLMLRYVKPGIYVKMRYVLSVLNDSFHKYILGQCTEAVILGALCTAGMLVPNLPYATMTGAVIAFTALIPVAGAYIGAGIGAFMILTVSPVKAIIFLIFIVVLQQLEGNLIYPRVVGSSLGLPAIWVLTAVTLGGGLMGIPGMLLCVPLAAALYRLVKEDVNRSQTKECIKV